jgi:hypothetical protein
MQCDIPKSEHEVMIPIYSIFLLEKYYKNYKVKFVVVKVYMAVTLRIARNFELMLHYLLLNGFRNRCHL